MTLICCKNWATKTIVRGKLSIRHDSVLSWNRPARIFRVKIILSRTGAVITKIKCHLHIHTRYVNLSEQSGHEIKWLSAAMYHVTHDTYHTWIVWISKSPPDHFLPFFPTIVLFHAPTLLVALSKGSCCKTLSVLHSSDPFLELSIQ